MGHARTRPKLEEGEVSSDDDCIIVDARVKKGRESPEVIQDHRHHLSTSKPNTTSYPFCSECCRYFRNEAEKERHYSKWHYGNLCRACDEGFPTESELLQHKSGHANTPICCVGCEKRFKCYSAMMDHLEFGGCESSCTGPLVRSVAAAHSAQFHRSSTRNINLQCSTCEKKFVRIAVLLKHFEMRKCTLRNWIEETGWIDFLVALKRSIAEKKPSTFQCNVCRKKFDQEVALGMHQREKHDNTYCCACETYFANPPKKQKHIISISGTSGKPGAFFCDLCDPKVRLGTEKELFDHLWLDHMVRGPCGQVFETAELKKKHDAKAHNRCSICYRFFVSTAELKQHRETHKVEPCVIKSPVVEPSITEPSIIHPLPVKPQPIPSLQRASKQLYR
ncbi:zinc finger protein [Fusarium coicis]|nr:zinc finger protein [Fusarium coicis]